MPRETVMIPLQSGSAYEAAATFFATMVYPDPADKTRREAFRIALCRWAILVRAKIDKDWSKSCQAITPELFGQEERFFEKTWDTGLTLFAKRVICASTMVVPHLYDEPLRLFGLRPTVDNLAALVAEMLGMSTESYKTIQSKLWAPTKSVAHAATAVALLRMKVPKLQQNSDWVKEHPLCEHDMMLGSMFYPDILSLLVNLSEKIRPRLFVARAFRIAEQSTIQFRTS